VEATGATETTAAIGAAGGAAAPTAVAAAVAAAQARAGLGAVCRVLLEGDFAGLLAGLAEGAFLTGLVILRRALETGLGVPADEGVPSVAASLEVDEQTGRAGSLFCRSGGPSLVLAISGWLRRIFSNASPSRLKERASSSAVPSSEAASDKMALTSSAAPLLAVS